MASIAENEDVEYVKVCFTCPDDIRRWVNEVTSSGDAPRYNHPGWRADIWGRTAVEIIDYIEDRFRETKDVQEYYACMLYLTKRMDAEELFVRWEDSQNYREIQAGENPDNAGDNTNTACQEKGSTGFKGCSCNFKGIINELVGGNTPDNKWRTIR